MLWNDDSAAFPKSFVEFVKIFSDKTAASLRVSALVAYPVNIALLNYSEACKQWKVQSEHKWLCSQLNGQRNSKIEITNWLGLRIGWD